MQHGIPDEWISSLADHCLVQAGNWENGSQMLNHLIKLGVDPVAYPPIAKALCKMARDLVAPTYNGLYPDGLRGQCILSRKVAPLPREPPLPVLNKAHHMG